MSISKIVHTAADMRPSLREQPQIPWSSFIDQQIHPVKVAIVEALRWVGGPLSAREIWLLGIDEPRYQNVAYHVKVLVEVGLLEQTHSRPTRGAAEKFYVLAGSEDQA